MYTNRKNDMLHSRNFIWRGGFADFPDYNGVSLVFAICGGSIHKHTPLPIRIWMVLCMRQVNLKFDKSKTQPRCSSTAYWLTDRTDDYEFNSISRLTLCSAICLFIHWRRQIHEIASDLIKWSFILSMLPHPYDLMMCEYKGWTVNVNIETEIATEMDWLYDNVP